MKAFIKKIVSKQTIAAYHKVLAKLSSIVHGHPTDFMIVIGVTGTNGKSSVVSFISQLLESLGKKTGYTTTAEFKVGDKIQLNDKKMTMLGRGRLQKMLQEMKRQKTEYAIIETSSQGIVQFRHCGINYDVAVFTNLTSEHIESHGSFENYKRAKISFFDYVAKASRKKNIDLNTFGEKIAVINADDDHGKDFVRKGFEKIVTFSMEDKQLSHATRSLSITSHTTSAAGSTFIIDNIKFSTTLFGNVTIYNIITAIATLTGLGFSLKELIEPVAALSPVPGRFEFIRGAQPFSVLIDYAPEPASLTALYETLKLFNYRRLIHVLGSAGGGRDTSRRPLLGSMAGKKADIVIVTNEDPYDEDPKKIIEQVAEGARSVGKKDDVDLFEILHRKEAIAKAFSIAKPGDFIIITGKGSEQAMVVKKGKKILWDDRIIARELLSKIVDNM